MSRRWLVAVSVVAHSAIVLGLVISGLWRIERVEAGRARTYVDPHPPPPPAQASGPVAQVTAPNNPKIRVKKFQPEKRPEVTTKTTSSDTRITGPTTDGPDVPIVSICQENCVEVAPPAPQVCGNSAREGDEQCDDGNAVNGDGCSSSCRIEEKPKPARPVAVMPSVLQGLRLSGETQVHPSTVTQNQMIRDDVRSVTGTVKLCIATDGSVSTVEMLRPTRYDSYDRALLAAVQSWRYRPYMVNHAPVSACSSVTFLYTIR